MSTKKKFNDINRRSFMQQMLAGAGFLTSFPGEIFLSNMIMHYLQRANALAADTNPLDEMKFINIGFAGGIPRWYWDSVLRPNGDDFFAPNAMLITKFLNSGQNPTGEYATVKVGDFYLPYTWASKIPTTSGNAVSMAALAQNMYSLRGVNTQVDSHDLNKARFLKGTPGGASISGLVADESSTPIPGLDRNGDDTYFGSKKGIATVSADGSNPLQAVMTPFLPGSNVLGLKSNDIDSAIDQAFAKMSKLSEGRHKYIPTTYQARVSAKNLMKKDFGNLQTVFNTLKNKYIALMNISFAATGEYSLAGVDDMTIAGQNHKAFQTTEENMYFSGSTIQNLTNENTYIANVAESFAVAEFMLSQNLSASINLIVGAFNNVTFSSQFNTSNNSSKGSVTGGHTTDIHFTGSHLSLVLFSRFYRAFSACLYEFISQLKSIPTSQGNLFNQTVISITSEFNRHPRSDGGGADHGWDGANYTLFSGMIKKPIVAGNIKNNTRSTGSHSGSWGEAAKIDLNGREVILGNAISTASLLLNVETPMPNDMSLCYKKNGSVESLLSKPQNIDKEEES